MPLFEVAILEKPKKKSDKPERLVLGPVSVIATDDQSAAIAAVLDAGDLEVDRTRMEVLVRPF